MLYVKVFNIICEGIIVFRVVFWDFYCVMRIKGSKFCFFFVCLIEIYLFFWCFVVYKFVCSKRVGF